MSEPQLPRQPRPHTRQLDMYARARANWYIEQVLFSDKIVMCMYSLHD